MKKFIPLLFIIAIIVTAMTVKFENKTGSNLQLKTTTDKILSDKEITWWEIDENETFTDKGKIIKYTYISDDEVKNDKYKGLTEDVSKRTHNAQFFDKGNGETVGKFYTKSVFYEDKEKGKWFKIKTATSSIEVFEEQIVEMFGASGDPIYSGAGDGSVSMLDDTSWDNSHDSETGTGIYDNSYKGIYPYVNRSSGHEWIVRGFLPIDTSALNSAAVISAATLYLFVNATGDNEGGYLALVETDQPDHTTLTTSDFNNCGTVDNPDKGSNDMDITAVPNDDPDTDWQSINLNATGLGWIKKSGEASNCGTALTGWTCLGIREGHDIEDNSPGTTGESHAQIYDNEYDSSSHVPYIEVTYAPAAERPRTMEVIIIE